MEQKAKTSAIAKMQGSHQAQSHSSIDVSPPLDGPRTLASQPVTVPEDVSLFPPSIKVDSWNGPAREIKPMLGVSIGQTRWRQGDTCGYV
jgi:hypothetical protein